VSHSLLYAARGCKASETGELYAARGCKASEISQLSEAEMEKASEHMELWHERASEKEKLLKAVYKRTQTKKMMEYEARSKEAAERRTQQQCSLSGGVYLRHRLEKRAFQNICLFCFS